MNFYIAEPVTRLPLFNFLVRYIFTEVLKRRFPENSQQLTIFEPILEGLQKVNPIENKGEYVDRVMCIIDIFAVAEPIKHNLREGLTVANASARLWNTEYVMVKE